MTRPPSRPQATLTLAGHVRSPGRPLPAAVLTLTDATGEQVASARSDDAGRFRLTARAPGEHVLVASRAGYRPVAIAVTCGGEALDVVLEALGTVRGTVLDAEAGTGVDAATVVALDPAGDVVTSTISDPDGSYRIEGLGPGGAVTLVVTTPAAVPVARTVTLDPAQGPDHVVDLPVARHGALAGTVTAGGHPVAGLVLHLQDAGGRTVASTTTGSDGGYRFTRVPAGPYTLAGAVSGPVTAVLGPTATTADLTLAPPRPTA